MATDTVSISHKASLGVNPEIITFIKSNLSENFKNINNKALDNLIKNITNDANNDINVIKKRLGVVNTHNDRYISYLFGKDFDNAGFVLDNYNIISSKIFNNDNFIFLGPNKQELIKLISEDNMQSIIKHINDDNFEKFVTKLIYDSKKHNINFGTETVKINSSEIISLLSERQSLSYFETGESTLFNRAINRLTEVTHRVDSDSICPYYKVAEGILKQRPDLVQIAKEYQTYMSKRGNEERVPYMKKFFAELETSGRLTHEIELKTVVPDENALVQQGDLLDIFMERGVASAKTF